MEQQHGEQLSCVEIISRFSTRERSLVGAGECYLIPAGVSLRDYNEDNNGFPFMFGSLSSDLWPQFHTKIGPRGTGGKLIAPHQIPTLPFFHAAQSKDTFLRLTLSARGPGTKSGPMQTYKVACRASFLLSSSW